jgi:hypothetical protein
MCPLPGALAKPLLVAAALAVGAPVPAPDTLPGLPGEIGNWSVEDRREFMAACRELKAGEEACACLLEVFERHAASLEEYQERYSQAREDAIEREGGRCERP